MASHGFPGGPCRLHLLFHEQMKILPEAAEEVKTDLTSVARRASGLIRTHWKLGEPHLSHLKSQRATGQTWTNLLSPTVSEFTWLNNISQHFVHFVHFFRLKISRTSSCFFCHLLGWQEELPEHVCLQKVSRQVARAKGRNSTNSTETQQKHHAEFLLHLFSKGFDRFCGLRGINF